jgi:predicted membrane channel-forming protein YqfA (hemolysin III family)
VSFGLALKFDADSKNLSKAGDQLAAIQSNNQAKAAQGAAIGLLVGGGVLFVTGVVLFFVGAPKAPEKAEAPKAAWHIVPGLGGASVVGTF